MSIYVFRAFSFDPVTWKKKKKRTILLNFHCISWHAWVVLARVITLIISSAFHTNFSHKYSTLTRSHATCTSPRPYAPALCYRDTNYTTESDIAWWFMQTPKALDALATWSHWRETNARCCKNNFYLCNGCSLCSINVLCDVEETFIRYNVWWLRECGIGRNS